eukprot:1969358-Pyramimonas_sp.AAC.1
MEEDAEAVAPQAPEVARSERRRDHGVPHQGERQQLAEAPLAQRVVRLRDAELDAEWHGLLRLAARQGDGRPGSGYEQSEARFLDHPLADRGRRQRQERGVGRRQ